MKKEIKLSEIVGYLPYGLKCQILNYKSDYIGEDTGIIDGYYFYAGKPHFYFNNGKAKGNAGKSFDLFKPILRPLSDLTKEIEVNDYKFIPNDFIKRNIWEDGIDCENSKTIILDTRKIEGINIMYLSDEFIQFFYEYHFDVHNLIERGLAIDINTI